MSHRKDDSISTIVLDKSTASKRHPSNKRALNADKVTRSSKKELLKELLIVEEENRLA